MAKRLRRVDRFCLEKKPTSSSRTANWRNTAKRALRVEKLEARLAMTAEGDVYTFNQSVDLSGIAGLSSAEAIWGDGTRSTIPISQTPASNNIRFRFDYSLDRTGFFNSATARSLLESAGTVLSSKLSDTLASIAPSGSNTWSAVTIDPSSGAQIVAPVQSVAQNEIYVYAGARNLTGTGLAVGGPGGWSASGNQAWLDTVAARGQAGALDVTPTDFGPWGGSIAFDSTANWYFGSDASGLTGNFDDFYSVAMHELTHLLGFGTADSWQRFVSGQFFVGPASRASNASNNVPLSADLAHWQSGVASNGQETLMDPELTRGTRKSLTALDLAALTDLGWQATSNVRTFSASHIYPDDGNFPVQLLIRDGQSVQSIFNVANAVITNVSPTLSQPTPITISVGTRVSVSDFATFSDPGFGAAETFRYEIDWADGTTISSGAATIDRAGGPNLLTLGSFDADHLYAVARTYNGTVRIRDDDGGLATRSFVINVTAPPTMQLTLNRSTISEAAGANAASLTITLGNRTSLLPTLIQLTSSDTTELTVPNSISIPASQTSITVPITAIDDTLLDGNQTVQISASIASLVSQTINMVVTDEESLTLSLNRSVVREDAGAGASVLRIVRSNTDVNLPLTVNLASSDTSEATGPTSVIIPAGQRAINVGLTAIDDSIVDGVQTAIFTATSSGYTSGNVGLQIADYEPITTVSSQQILIEGSTNQSSTSITVRLPSPAPTGGVTLQLQSVPIGQLILPANLTVPAGQSTFNFEARLRDDAIVEGTQTLTLSIVAAGYVTSNIILETQDDDFSPYTNSDNRLDVNNRDGVTSLDVLAVVNAINRFGVGPVSRIAPDLVDFIDVTGNGILEPLDVLAIVNFINSQRRR